jgi:hypothetical protein
MKSVSVKGESFTDVTTPLAAEFTKQEYIEL